MLKSKKKSILSGKMLVILPAAFVTSFAIGVMALGLLFVVKDVYNASAVITGNLGAVWSIAYFIGCIVLGKFTGKPRLSMFIMLSSSSVILFLFVIFDGIVQAFVAYSLYGFITALFWPPLMGWLSKDLEGTELNKATSLFSLAWSSGSIFSSYIAGILSEHGKFIPIILAASLFGANAIFVVLSNYFVKDTTENVHHSKSQDPQQDTSTSLRFPAWVGVFLAYSLAGVILNIFPVFAREQLHISESAIGFTLTIRALATAAVFTVLGSLTFWHYKRRILPALSLAIAIICVILIFATGTASFSVLFALSGILHAFMYNNSLFYATSGAKNKTRRANIHEAILNLGQVFGSLCGGVLYHYASMASVFLGLAGLAIFATIIQSRMIYKAKTV